MQRPVGRRHPVAVLEHPVAADAVRRLEAVEGEAALVQRLGGGDAGRPGADHADRGERGHGFTVPELTVAPRSFVAGCRAWTPTRRRSRRRAASSGARGDPPEIVIVHRPRYDDWSLPKGKLDPGEGWEEAALREVEEEVGLRCRLGGELPPTSYRDNKGRAKVVRYWLMEADEAARVHAERRGRRDALGPVAEAAGAAHLRARRASSCGPRRRHEPRALPRPGRRLGAARRPGRHADGRRRDRGDGRLDALRAAAPTTAACSRPRTRRTSASRRRARRSAGCSARRRTASPSARR